MEAQDNQRWLPRIRRRAFFVDWMSCILYGGTFFRAAALN